jgi:hypothetical protein
VEGAAGAGKTTTLAATRQALERQGARLLVVTPTLKASKVAATEVGTAAGSAAAFAYAHGWRWNDDSAWTRLTPGQTDPVTGQTYAGPGEGAARLRPGDLLVVDEAGMLDQDTARALLTVADECSVRVALVGDRHQLAAVGRGGVLDLAVDGANPAGHLILDGVHRFIRTDPDGRKAPDSAYADLTLAMRTGDDPGAVFDALVARGQIRIHAALATLQEALARLAAAPSAAGGWPLIVADTRETVADLNAAIRGALIAAGRVDDETVATTFAGQRMGVGDLVVTRRNDGTLGVANRDTWIVTRVGRHGGLRVTPAAVTGTGTAPDAVTPTQPVHAAVTPTGVGTRVLPATYVGAHVELAYACTAHGAQGDTVPTAHLVVGEHTGAGSAYVGMTRGREGNTAHLIADDLSDAREQWIAVFARDRADLGAAHAGQLAAEQAARYAPARRLEEVRAELRSAWTAKARDWARLAALEPKRDTMRRVVALEAPHVGELPRLKVAHHQAERAEERAQQAVRASAAAIAAEGDRLREQLFANWNAERDAASAAARVIRAGPGRLGFRRGAVNAAHAQLADWADRWRPYVATLPTDPKELARGAGWSDNRNALSQAFHTWATRAAGQAHPEHAEMVAAAEHALRAEAQARSDLNQAREERDKRRAPFGLEAWTTDPAARLAELERDIATTSAQLTDTQARIAACTAELAHSGQPADRLAHERDTWHTQQAAEEKARRQAARTAAEKARRTRSEGMGYYAHRRDHTPDRGRGRGR